MRASVRAVEDMLKDEDNEVTPSFYNIKSHYGFVKRRLEFNLQFFVSIPVRTLSWLNFVFDKFLEPMFFCY
jgi:hypothetical protein